MTRNTKLENRTAPSSPDKTKGLRLTSLSFLIKCQCVCAAVFWTIYCIEPQSVLQTHTSSAPRPIIPHHLLACSPLKLLSASLTSVVVVSPRCLRSGAGPTSDERRGGAAAPVGFGDEQGGESEGRSEHTNTLLASLVVLVMTIVLFLLP